MDRKHTKEDLKELQALPLSQKILASQARIIEWYQHFDGKVYVSFSGGKDSTVLLHLVRSVYPDVLAVYIDTGLEYPKMREFVKSFDNVKIIKPKMNFREVIDKYGYPVGTKEIANKIDGYKRGCEWSKKYVERTHIFNGKVSRYCVGTRYDKLIKSDVKVSSKCCDVMKKRPVKRFEKESGLHPYIGTMAEESALRRTKWITNGCNLFISARPMSLPLSFWTQQDILEYILKYNLEIAPPYGEVVRGDDWKLRTTGCSRTGCMFCGFGAHLEKHPNRFERMKETYPQVYDWCMKPWDEGGLGMKEVLDLVGVKY